MGKHGGRRLQGGELFCWALGSSEATATGGREFGSERWPMSAATAQLHSSGRQDSVAWWV